MKCFQFLASFVTCCVALGQAHLRILVVSADSNAARAVEAAVANATEEHPGIPIMVRALSASSLLGPTGTGRLDFTLLRRVARLTQERWPKDEVFVLDSHFFDEIGLHARLSKLLSETPGARRREWRRSQGLLWLVRAKISAGRGSLRCCSSAALAPEALSKSASSLSLKAESNGQAEFSRNGILFDDVAGGASGRGINIVQVNQISGEIECIYDFDTWLSTDLANQLVTQFVPGILPERIVMFAVADANIFEPDAVTAFQNQFGSTCAAESPDTWAGISENGKILAEQCGQYSTTAGVPDSVGGVSTTLAPSTDVTPPAGSFNINSGAAVTSTNLVTLDLSAITDTQSGLMPGGKVRLSNDGVTWAPMMDFSRSMNWVLERGYGEKTVSAQFRDRAGNWTDTLTANITLNESNPLTPVTGTPSGTFCAAGSTLLALSSEGTIATSASLGAVWAQNQNILPVPASSYGWDQTILNCDSSGRVAAVGVLIDNSQVLIAANVSSDTGRTWLGSPITKTVAVNTPTMTSILGACASSAGSATVFWSDYIGGNEQVFALSSPNSVMNWSSSPVQVTSASSSSSIDTYQFQAVCGGSVVLTAVGQTGGVTIYGSHDAGNTFNAGTQLPGDLYDSQLAIDPTGATAYLFSAGPEVVVRSSTDGGANWGIPVLVANSLADNLQVSVPAPGLLYAAWVAQISGSEGWAIQVAASKDGGVTWSAQPALVSIKGYWFSYMWMSAEKPLINDFALTANSTGAVQVVWTDSRQGLGGWPASVQRFGVFDVARTGHEDAEEMLSIDDLYIASSTDFSSTWSISGPLNATLGSYPTPVMLNLTSSGTAISMWTEDYVSYADVRVLGGSGVPSINSGGIVNAASFATPVAAGSLATLFGINLADATYTNLFDPSHGVFSTSTSSGVSVVVDGVQAPLTYVSATQINFQVPWETPSSAVNVQVARHGVMSAPVSMAFSVDAPSAFLDSSSGAALVTSCTGGVPASGSVCTIWGNGFGPKNGAQQDGAPAPTAPASLFPLEVPGEPASCDLTIAGVSALVTYCGAAPGEIIDQLNFEYPAGISASSAFVGATLTINGIAGTFNVPAPAQ